MADDFRNFRSYYYDKVGFRGVEEKKSLEMLLNEKPLNLMKISQFCLRFSLPVMYREYVWNILLGVCFNKNMTLETLTSRPTSVSQHS